MRHRSSHRQLISLPLRVLVDGSYNLFLRPGQINNIKIEPAPRQPDFRRTLHNQWGLSLLLDSKSGADNAHGYARLRLYRPKRSSTTWSIVGVDPKKIEALIVSHGHFDHYGGLLGMLDKYRSALPADLTLYAGGEDNFCQRLRRTARTAVPSSACSTGASLASRKVKTVLCENPTVIVGHAFTTGQDQALRASKRFCPTPPSSSRSRTGSAARQPLISPAETGRARSCPDEHIHEHATCFNREGPRSHRHQFVRPRRHPQFHPAGAWRFPASSKIHALIGGFHLGPAPADYLGKVIAEVEDVRARTSLSRCIAAAIISSSPCARRCRRSWCWPRPAAASLSAPKAWRRSEQGPARPRLCRRLRLSPPAVGHRGRRSGGALGGRIDGCLMWNKGRSAAPSPSPISTGKPRSDDDFRGKLLLIYFGYTYCADVCPTDLQADRLGDRQARARGEAVQPFFITLDPEHDTAAALSSRLRRRCSTRA